jgi:hypothetical protein
MFGFGSMGVVLFMLVVFRRDEDHGALVVNQLGLNLFWCTRGHQHTRELDEPIAN